MPLTKEQLAERKNYIGASEAAAVIGVSRYSTPLKVWGQKTGQLPALEEETLPMWVGNEMEEIIAKRFTLETGKKVQRVNSTVYHKIYPFLACHLDRKVVGENAILQCKTASAYKEQEWDDDIPIEYIIQEFHELACSGYEKAYIACLIGNHKFVIKEIIFKEHKKTIDDLIAKEVYFWEKFVLTKIMPALILADDSDVLFQLYPTAGLGTELPLGDEGDKIIEALLMFESEYKALELNIEQQKNYLKAMLKDNEAGITNNFRVTWKVQSSKRIDVEKMKAEVPALAEKYSKTTESRVLRKSKLKQGGVK